MTHRNQKRLDYALVLACAIVVSILMGCLVARVAHADEYPPPPPPLGWMYGPYLVCSPGQPCVVATDAHGLNVRQVPNGPVTVSLVNGTPVVPYQAWGNWLLVGPACPLVTTYLWSVTAGVPLLACGR